MGKQIEIKQSFQSPGVYNLIKEIRVTHRNTFNIRSNSKVVSYIKEENMIYYSN